MLMNWIKVGNIRINLDHVVYIEPWMAPDEAKKDGELEIVLRLYFNTKTDGITDYLQLRGDEMNSFFHEFRRLGGPV
jgi:hypothetical protein